MCTVAPIPHCIDDPYKDAYTASTEADRKNRRLAADYLQKLTPYFPSGRFRLLEVGGSYGWLAQLIRDRFGADVHLLEPGRTAVASAQARGVSAEAGFIEQFDPAAPFDLLCATHVIEHVQDLGGFLTACRRALSPRGLLLLLTPNATAWKLKRFGATWAWAVPEQHTVFLSPVSAAALLAKHGFDLVRITPLTPAFAHYPFFLVRILAEWRARWPAFLRKAAGLFTRPLALLEYAVLRALDSCSPRNGADELLIVASRRE